MENSVFVQFDNLYRLFLVGLSILGEWSQQCCADGIRPKSDSRIKWLVEIHKKKIYTRCNFTCQSPVCDVLFLVLNADAQMKVEPWSLIIHRYCPYYSFEAPNESGFCIYGDNRSSRKLCIWWSARKWFLWSFHSS